MVKGEKGQSRGGAAGVVFRDPLTGVLLLLALSSVFGALFLVGADAYGTDFYRYWIGAKAVRAAWSDNIYSEQGRETIEQKSLAQATNPASRLARAAREVHTIDGGRVEMLGTPFVFTVFAAGYSGDYDRDFQFYRVLSLVLYVVAILLVCRLARLPLAASLALLAFLAFFFGPFQAEARLGNVNRVQLAMIALFLWIQGRDRWRPRDVVSGFVLGLSVMFKPILAIAVVTVFALWWMSQRRRKVVETAAGAALGAGVAVGVSGAFFGSLACWTQWLDVLPQVLNSQRSSADGNMGLSRIILETFNVDLSYVLLALFLALVLVVGWTSRRRDAVDRPPTKADEGHTGASSMPRELYETFLGLGLGISVMWLSMRLAWAYYLLLLIPFAAYCLRPAPVASTVGARAARLGCYAALVFLVLLSPVGAVVSGGVRADPRLASLAVLSLYAAGVVQLKWPPESSGP